MKARINVTGKIAAAVGLAVLFAGLAGPLAAETKNYYFPEVRIRIDVREDGSFAVDEFRTYEFRGRFSWTKLWIPLRVDREGYLYDASIEEFKVFDEQGTPLRLETGIEKGAFQAKWYYSARNERRTFHIRYIVKGGVISYPELTRSPTLPRPKGGALNRSPALQGGDEKRGSGLNLIKPRHSCRGVEGLTSS